MIFAALRLSLTVALASTALVASAGTLAGWVLARSRFRGKETLDALLNLPLVLPPTVTGYYLIALLGRRGPLGAPLFRATGWSIPFTWAACVAAAAVMAFPLMVRSARVAFEGIDPRHEIASASLGHGWLSYLLRIALPVARRGLASGVVLVFARSIGEFGATLMIAGNIPGRTQTLPLAIYDAVLAGEDRTALGLSALLTAVSVGVMLAAGRLGRRRR
ncbi:MAG: molybdate ABC transporter permease subunit [Acidobacteriia bacterium]|nr:molybdate ABC transporter permease subunit [Terriglobia bacterium]